MLFDVVQQRAVVHVMVLQKKDELVATLVLSTVKKCAALFEAGLDMLIIDADRPAQRHE